MANLSQLQKRVQTNREERERAEKRDKIYAERLAEVETPPARAMQDFWCTECKRDFSALGYKQVRRPQNGYPIAWYVSPCPNGHNAIRRITDKINDPYYRLSENVRRQQAKHADDFMLPSDPRFKYKYPTQWKRIQDEQARREEAGLI